MIQRHTTAKWRVRVPRSEDFQAAQELFLSQALTGIFSDPVLAGAIAFRGGKALYMLFLTPPARRSGDICLIQLKPEPPGPKLTGFEMRLISGWAERRECSRCAKRSLAAGFVRGRAAGPAAPVIWPNIRRRLWSIKTPPRQRRMA